MRQNEAESLYGCRDVDKGAPIRELPPNTISETRK